MIMREKGEGKATEASEEVIYKIDVPANRLANFTQMKTYRSLNNVIVSHSQTTEAFPYLNVLEWMLELFFS